MRFPSIREDIPEMEKYSIREENMARSLMHKLTIKIVEGVSEMGSAKEAKIFFIFFFKRLISKVSLRLFQSYCNREEKGSLSSLL